MKKLIVLLLLLPLIVFSKYDDLVSIGKDELNQEYFVDMTTIRKIGHKRSRVVFIVNYFRDGVEQSAKNFVEIDCKDYQIKILKLTLYSLPWGLGNQVRYEGEGHNWDWVYIEPNSKEETVKKFACGQK